MTAGAVPPIPIPIPVSITIGLPTPTPTSVSVPLAAAASSPTSFGTPRGVLVLLLIAVGCFFLLVGTIGLLRLPDVYNRTHATSKASTLGASSIFLSGVAYFGPQEAGLTALVGIVFLFLTAPTGAHMISRAAEKMGVPFYGDVEWPADPKSASDPDPDPGSRSGSGTETRTSAGTGTEASTDDADR